MSDNVKVKKPRSTAKKTKTAEASVEVATELAAESLAPEPSKNKGGKKESAPVVPAAVQATVEMEEENFDFLHARAKTPINSEIKVKLSEALYRKLNQQAQEESLTVEELVRELLAESVVLRAWEIIERKNQMRGGSQNNAQSNRPQNNHQGNNNNNHRGNHRKGGHRGGMSQMRYNSIMDDKASFLEYVRNQERNRR